MAKPRAYRQRKYTVPRYICTALQTLKPPERVRVSEWAQRNRVLSLKESALPGKWKNELTPYLVGIMDEFSNYETEEIIFVKPTQVGGTSALLNILGSVIDQDPAPAMIVYPTDVLAESTSENRIRPMLEDTEALRVKYRAQASQRLELQFDGMYLVLSGANSPSSLASKPIRYLFLDEVDKYPEASRREADPISLARERTKTYANRKIFMTSTPTLRTGHIWKALQAADDERHYFVPCVHCGKMIEFQFSHLKWPGDEDGTNTAADRADMACYVCQECGGVITDADKLLMLRRGQWKSVRKAAKNVRSVAFWINTLYSPFTSWARIAKAKLDAGSDPDLRHNFQNSWLAEPWEDTQQTNEADVVFARQTELPPWTVPDWARLITGGVDVQRTGMYYTVRAWGEHLTSQCIGYGFSTRWDEIARVMNTAFPTQDGSGSMVVDLALVDSGDQTDDVYDFCAKNAEWALACKGTATGNSHYRVSTVNRAGSAVNGMKLILVDGGKYKDMIASRMRRENGEGSWMVFDGVGDDYAQMVTAEHKVTETHSGREVTRWVQRQSHGDNHYLDCEVYAMAAADLLGVRTLFLEQEARPEPRNTGTGAGANVPEETWIRDNDNWV